MDVGLRQLELLHEFGGKGPTLHLAHANGFPPGTYYYNLSYGERFLWIPPSGQEAPRLR